MRKVPIIYYCMDCSFSTQDKHYNRCPRCEGVIFFKRADNKYSIRQGKYDVERYWDFLPLQDPGKLIGRGNEVTPLVAVSYTHLDVYKRQLLHLLVEFVL